MTWEEFIQKDADTQRYLAWCQHIEGITIDRLEKVEEPQARWKLAQYQQIEGITLDRLEKVKGVQTRWNLAHYQQIGSK